jgi:Spy/CpxP family protein refolding chaperone
MKKTHIIRTILVMALAMASQLTFAQRGQMDPEKRAERVSADLKQALTLDDATTKKVYDLELVRTQEAKKLREANAGDREAMRESMKGINEKFQTSIKGIFTEEQFKKYQEWQAAEREKRGQRGGGNRRRK